MVVFKVITKQETGCLSVRDCAKRGFVRKAVIWHVLVH